MPRLALRIDCLSVSSSRIAHVTRSPNNPASGLGVKRCHFCSIAERETKETIHNGLLLLRVRYGIPYSELPDCKPGELSRFLSFLLLQGKERASVEFPRRQRRGNNGLCRLQRLCRMERWIVAHSCASIKRNLPKGCHRHTPSVRSAWEQNALSKPPPTSPEYLSFVKREVTQLFSSCWDRNYGYHVGSYVANPTARVEIGSRADLLWSGRRSEFFTLTTRETDLFPLFTARYKEVQSAGKKRPLLIYDDKVDLLAPLHLLMYNHLRKYDWLLCGPPSEDVMSSVCTGEYQTSVDLVSATDGLRHDVTKTILDALFFTSVKIPHSIRSLAFASLSPVFRDGEGVHRRVSHGQMMGSYLSFPLLCIQSYCAARWAARFDCNARFLVNGDDCVISANRVVTVQDYPQGYRLNDDKTIRAKNVVEINSTAFLKQGSRWREVRHLRRGGAPADFPGMMHMAKAVCVHPGFVDAWQHARIGRRWGFLPSQLNHFGYPAYKRERGLRVRRAWSALPEAADSSSFPEELVRITGRDPTPVEAEALRVAFWLHGRMGGLKRDVFSPSCGKVRRTYIYRAQPCRSHLSFVGRGGPKSCFLRVKKPDWFLVPASFQSEEETRGLVALDQFRRNWDRGFIELLGGALDN
nr:MAG: RNA-dependent RNA polymerase [Lwood associated botourmia-like virus]